MQLKCLGFLAWLGKRGFIRLGRYYVAWYDAPPLFSDRYGYSLWSRTIHGKVIKFDRNMIHYP